MHLEGCDDLIPLPPLYQRKPHALTYHDDTRSDPYYYLRETSRSEQSRNELRDENRHTRGVLNAMHHVAAGLIPAVAPKSSASRLAVAEDTTHEEGEKVCEEDLEECDDPVDEEQEEEEDEVVTTTKKGKFGPPTKLEETLFQEMKQRWQESDVSLPFLIKGRWYLSRSVKGFEHGLVTRMMMPMTGAQSSLPPSPPLGATSSDPTSRLDLQLAALLWDHPSIVVPLHAHETVLIDVNELAQDVNAFKAAEDGGSSSSTAKRTLKQLKEEKQKKQKSAKPSEDGGQDGDEEDEPPFVELGEWHLSTDGKQCVCAVDLSDGREQYSIVVLDLSQSEQLPLRSKAAKTLPGASASLSGPSLPADTSFKSKKGQSSSSNKKKRSSSEPVHCVTRVIEAFPSSSEVRFHLGDGILYIAQDETTQRPYRLVYHDLRIEDVHDERADTILFEERDPEFYVGSLSLSDDESYVMFQSSSSSTSEVYFLPRMYDIRHFLQTQSSKVDSSSDANEVQIAQAEEERSGTTDDDDDDCPVVFANPFHLLCPRKEGLEIASLAYHPHLLSEAGGGWLIASNREHCENFVIDWFESVDDFSTDEKQNTPTTGTHSTTPHPLFEYDPNVVVESLSLTSHWLLISGRYRGFPHAWWIPVSMIQQRIAALRDRHPSSSEKDISLLSITKDASSVLDLLVGKQIIPVSDFVVDAGRATAGTQDTSPASSEGTGRERLFIDALRKVQQESSSSSHSSALFQVAIVDAYPASEEFDETAFRISISHPTFPDELYELRYVPSSSATSSSSSFSTSVAVLGMLDPVAILVRRERVRGPPYDPMEYSVERLWVPVPEGIPTTSSTNAESSSSTSAPEGSVVNVPVTLIYRTELFVRGESPCKITAYGSYGDSTDPTFSAQRLSLLDRGVVYAVAHIRGGGELGRAWRDGGRLHTRANSIHDFVACSQYLIQQRWCHPHRLACEGGSAGGTIVAGALLQAPSLYRCVLALVPFVDCLTTMLDPSLPLTSAEWEEWGNPLEDAAAYRCIQAYSPMDVLDRWIEARDSQRTIGSGSVGAEGADEDKRITPFLFVDSGYGDPRVPHWEPMAFVARWRQDLLRFWNSIKAPPANSAAAAASVRGGKKHAEAKKKTTAAAAIGKWIDSTDAPVWRGPVVVHRCHLNAGHGGGSGRYEQLREYSMELAFLLLALWYPV